MKKINKFISISLILSLILSPTSIMALTKEETIYSSLKANGEVSNFTITNHLVNNSSDDIIDQTDLKDILNINGDEAFIVEGSKLTWKAKGKDIFYKGVSEKTLPIDISVKYYLNGIEKKREELIGSKGKIKMTISFTNKLKQDVMINGSYESLYTPFVVTLGTIIDNNANNISITNGKVISTGNKNIIVGISSPGLSSSLNINSKNLDEITISYDTNSFKSNSIYVLANPKVLEETDLSIFNKLDSLYTDINTLKTGMDTLEKGSNQLKDGTLSLVNGASSLSSNLKNVSDATDELEKGMVSLNGGIDTMISSITSATSTLNNEEVKNSLVQLNQLKMANSNTINSIVSKTGHTKEELKTLYDSNNLKDYSGNDVNLISLKTNYELIMLLEINNSSIDSMISAFNGILTNANYMTTSILDGLTKLKDGSNAISSGLNSLGVGIDKLYIGSTDLVNGTNNLYEGSKNLNDGVSKINQEGINKLFTYVLEVKNYSDRLKKLVELSDNYKGFASSNSNNTNFVYVIK